MPECAPRVVCLFHRGFKLFPRGFKQLEALDDSEYDVTVFCADRSGLPSREYHGGIELRRVSVPWPSFAPLKPLFLVWSLLRLCIEARAVDDVDVYHCFGIYSMLPGLLLSQFNSASLSYDAFEDYRYQFVRSGAIPFATEWFGDLLVQIERSLVSHSDHVFVVPSADDILEQRFARLETGVTTLWNVPRLEEGTLSSDTQDDTDDGTVQVIYVGNMSIDKGALEMVEAAVRTLHRVDYQAGFVFIGGFDEELEREVRQAIPADVAEQIDLRGFVPYEEVAPYLSSADVALELYQRTFWHEQSMASSKLFRYMAAQLPIVVSDFPGIGSLVRDNGAGVAVNPADPDAVADRLCELIEDKAKREQLGENGYSAFQTRYNWDIESDKFLEAFAKIVA